MTETDDRDPLDELAEDFLARWRRGERPAVSEYVGRHPDRAVEIRDLISALVMVEGVRSEADPTLAPAGLRPPGRGTPTLERLGDFRILREIGRGGMGVVYEAEQESLGRHVALKVLSKRSLLADDHVRRFLREARAAARLHHTNIVPVFGVGEHDGLHYYVMQFIHGPGLDKVLDEVNRLRGRGAEGRDPADATTRVGRFDPSAAEVAKSLVGASPPLITENAGSGPLPDSKSPRPKSHPSPASDADRRYARTVARFGMQVAEALEYAHRQGVLHRDVKPSNLLLDAQGTVWVTDFGLAKATEDDDLTRTGDLVGTLRYMAPERFDGRCDARSDLYALGLTLYELLAGRPAFDAPDRDRLIFQVTQTDAPRLHDLCRSVPRDLDTIIQKTIERSPDHRYATAGELARDLDRFLADRPIEARRTSAVERAARWARRNPGLSALTATVAVLLVTIAVGSTVAAVHLSRKHAEALTAGREARERLWESYLAQARARRRGGEAGRRFDALACVDAASRLGVHADRLWVLRDEAIACTALADLRRLEPRSAPSLPEDPTAFDARFQRLARLEADGRITIRRASDDVELASLPAPTSHPVSFRFSSDGRRLAAKCEADGRAGLTLWDLDRRETLLDVPEGVAADAFEFSPDGRWLAAGRRDGSIDLYDAKNGRSERRLPAAAPPSRLAFDPASRRLAVTSLSAETALQIRDLDGGGEVKETFPLPEPAVGLAWHPDDGRTLAVGGEDGSVFLIDSPTSGPPAVLRGHQGSVVSAAFHPESHLLATASRDGTIRLWDVDSRETVVSAPLPNADRIRFSPDGRLLGPGRDGPTRWLWEVAAGRAFHTRTDRRGPIDSAGRVTFASSPSLLIAHGESGLRFDSLPHGRVIGSLPLAGTSSYAFLSNGSRLVTGGESGLLNWPVETKADGTIRIGPPAPFAITAGLPTGRIALAPDGRTLAVVLDRDRGRGVIFDSAAPARQIPFAGHPGLDRLAFSPDSRRLATGAAQGVNVYDARTGRLEAELPVDGAADVLFSPDGRWLVTGSGAEYRAWAVGTWEKRRGIERVNTGGAPGKMAFAPDGASLALVRSRAAVQIVDPDSFEVLATLVPPVLRNVSSLAFEPDGSRLAVAHNSRVVSLWDFRTARSELKLLGLDLPLPALPTNPPPSAASAASVHVEPPPWLASIAPGDAFANDGQWTRAAEAYAAALKSGDRSPQTWSRHALLSLATGDAPGHRAACREMLDHFGDDVPPAVARHLVRACVAAPDSVPTPPHIVRLAETALGGRSDVTGLNTHGAALYRAGRFEQALRALESGVAAHASGGSEDGRLFLAMTCHRLGRHADAKSWLGGPSDRSTDAAIPAPGDPWDRLFLEPLRAEARSLIDAAPHAPADPRL